MGWKNPQKEVGASKSQFWHSARWLADAAQPKQPSIRARHRWRSQIPDD
jgi:hypothetical protein